ncbi:MAG: PEP-CTERM sorting domain-containing protein, partial [Planctomycetes bacterium]|nr:PEP-CTERM sorting domain-containing protein [Planctomycetota bacterium]
LDGTGPKASLAVFTQDGNQNYVVAVPEPTTIALLGLGGIMSLARKRRRA